MKNLLLVLFLLFVFSISHAQQQIIVQDGNNATIYSNLDTAVVMAPSGAYIYLPGGTFGLDASGLIIDKKLHIIGVGHYPDSTTATGRTYIDGDIILLTGAENSTLEGFYINGNINFGNANNNDALRNIIIDRISVSGIRLGSNGALPNSENILIKNCVIRHSIQGYSVKYAILNNNFIGDGTGTVVSSLNKSTISGNIISGSYYYSFGSYYPLSSINDSKLEGNIFITNEDSFYKNSSNLRFFNNVFNFSPNLNNQIAQGNIFTILPENIFISYTANQFNYDDNYHLKPNSPAIGAGTNGTDIGIYGGNEPYKEGAVPHNPHIQFQNIHGQTDTQGNLKVEIRVRAQDN